MIRLRLTALALAAGLPVIPGTAYAKPGCTPVAFRRVIDLVTHFDLLDGAPARAFRLLTPPGAPPDAAPLGIVVDTAEGRVLYADPELEGYRELYLQAHGLEALPEGYQVDHVYNKASARNRYGLVRLEAIDADVNQQTGSVWESRRSRMFDRRSPDGSNPSVVCADPFQRFKLQARLGAKGRPKLPISARIRRTVQEDGVARTRTKRELRLVDKEQFDAIRAEAKARGTTPSRMLFEEPPDAPGNWWRNVAKPRPLGMICVSTAGATIAMAAEAGTAYASVQFAEGMNKSEVVPGKTLDTALGDAMRQGVGDSVLLTLNDAGKTIRCKVRPISDAAAKAALAAGPTVDAVGDVIDGGQDLLAEGIVAIAGAEATSGTIAAAEAGLGWLEKTLEDAGTVTADAIGETTKAAYELSHGEGLKGYMKEVFRFYARLDDGWEHTWERARRR